MLKSAKVILAALLALPLANGALAEPVTLKMHSILVESRPEAQSFQEFVDKVSENSNGELTIELYQGGSLGIKDQDLLRVMPSGTVDMAAIYGEYLARDVPELAYVYVPGAITRPEQQLEIMPTVQEITQDIYSRYDIRVIQAVQTPIRTTHVFCSEPVNTLEELRSRKLRVWSRHLAETFARLGVAAQVVAQNDLYVALKTGLVDCALYPASTAHTLSLHEVTPYAAYLFPYAGVPFNICITEAAWSRLDDAQQKALQDAGDWIWEKTASYFAEEGVQGEARAIEALQEKGVTVLDDFSEADRNAFTEAAREVWLELVSDVNEAAVENREKILEAVN